MLRGYEKARLQECIQLIVETKVGHTRQRFHHVYLRRRISKYVALLLEKSSATRAEIIWVLIDYYGLIKKKNSNTRQTEDKDKYQDCQSGEI